MSLLTDKDTLVNLDSETRQKIIDLLELRSRYSRRMSKLADLQLVAVQDPTEANIKAVEEYSEKKIKLLKETMNALTLQIARSLISQKMPKGIPSSLDELFEIVNPSGVLRALGVDPDKANSIIESLRKRLDI